jgi:hypothetical protein
MKYIVVRAQGIETAILAVDLVTHSMAVNKQEVKPLSAGFFHVKNGEVIVSDQESTSLKLKPRSQDAAIIRATLFMMGLMKDAPAEDIARAYGFDDPEGLSETFLTGISNDAKQLIANSH